MDGEVYLLFDLFLSIRVEDVMKTNVTVIQLRSSNGFKTHFLAMKRPRQRDHGSAGIAALCRDVESHFAFR